MKATKTAARQPRRRRATAKDLTAAKRGSVKGGLVIDWKTTSAARPGEERGVIAIIKTAGGA
jgi:hypothetical protein